MKNILVTGVSKGLGLITTEVLLRNNYCVYGISRTTSDALIKLQEEYPNQLNIYNYDLSDSKNIKKIFTKTFLPLSLPIYGFVNNAAFAYDDIATNMNYKPLEEMYKVNVFTPLLLTKYVIRNMLFNRIKGSLIHISSISAHTGYKGLSMYASTKGAIEAFSKSIAREWGVKEIRSNCIAAGFMETDMNKILTDEQRSKIYNRTSMKKETSKDSVAETIEFLLSDKSISITGQNIFVDSGTI